MPYQQSVVLKEALEAVGADVQLQLIPDADHVFIGVNITPLIAASTEYLRDRLR